MPDRSPRRCSTRCCCACCHILYSSGVPCSAAQKSGDAGRHITAILAPRVPLGVPLSMFISRGRWCTGGPLQRMASSYDKYLRFTRVWACWTVQISPRMIFFVSRRWTRSGSSSTSYRARDPVTAWCPWGATSTCLGGTQAQVRRGSAMMDIVWVHAR